MARFNSSKAGSTKVTNRAGGAAYKLSDEVALYTAACTSMLAGKYYETENQFIDRLRKLVASTDASFVQKLAYYSRTKMYLRTMPIVLLAELAKLGRLSKEAVAAVIQRPDEITELLAYYQKINGRKGTKKLNKLSVPIIKGIKQIFEQGRFSEYQLAKYNRDGEVKLRDAMFISHPKPSYRAQCLEKECKHKFAVTAIYLTPGDSQVAKNARAEERLELANTTCPKCGSRKLDCTAVTLARLATKTMDIPETWEVKLSAAGSDVARKKAVWEELIDRKVLGYMATLRNLRNMLQANISAKHVQKVCDFLSNPKAVANSKQFPFRFLSAYKELEEANTGSGHAGKILEALEQAMIESVKLIPGFNDNTVVCMACDTSGSMDQQVSDRSKMCNVDVGLVLATMLQSRCTNVITGIFGDTWKVINVPKSNILANVGKLRKYRGVVGYSTNGYMVVEDLISRKIKVDKLMLFTDLQLWNSTTEAMPGWARFTQGDAQFTGKWHEYKQKVNPKAELILFDLAGHGDTPVSIAEEGVVLVAGWSSEVFKAIESIKCGAVAIEDIKKINLKAAAAPKEEEEDVPD